MVFSSTFVRKECLPGGIVKEEGTWSGAAVTTGNITCDTTEQPEIVRIDDWQAEAATEENIVSGSPNVLQLTFTSGDSGKYVLYGKAR